MSIRVPSSRKHLADRLLELVELLLREEAESEYELVERKELAARLLKSDKEEQTEEYARVHCLENMEYDYDSQNKKLADILMDAIYMENSRGFQLNPSRTALNTIAFQCFKYEEIIRRIAKEHRIVLDDISPLYLGSKIPYNDYSEDGSTESAKQARQNIREKLIKGDKVKVVSSGSLSHVPDEATIESESIVEEKLANQSEEDKEQERQNIREKLLNGEAVKVADDYSKEKRAAEARRDIRNFPLIGRHGEISWSRTPDYSLADEFAYRIRNIIRSTLDPCVSIGLLPKKIGVYGPDTIVVPSIKGIMPEVPKRLQASWYEINPDLLELEKQAMAHCFPQFNIDELADGRLYWYGCLEAEHPACSVWYLQAIYDNDYPGNNSHERGIRIYPIEPDLNELENKVNKMLPYTKRDSAGYLYMSLAGMNLGSDGSNGQPTMATSLFLAVKWITEFELWMADNYHEQKK